MTSTVFLILVAVITGIAVALQGQFMGQLNRSVGTLTSILLTYGLGGLLAVLVWLVKGGSLEGARRIPWYVWSSGALGLVIVGGLSYAAPRLGLSQTVVLTIAAQLIAAVLIDTLGLFGTTARSIDVSRALGIALTVAGAWLVVKA